MQLLTTEDGPSQGLEITTLISAYMHKHLLEQQLRDALEQQQQQQQQQHHHQGRRA
jgi:hypothetical protein